MCRSSEINAAIYLGSSTFPASSVFEYFNLDLRPLETITIRERQTAATAVRKTRLHVCIDSFNQDPKNKPGVSDDTMPQCAFISCFRTFQTSSAHINLSIDAHETRPRHIIDLNIPIVAAEKVSNMQSSLKTLATGS